MERGKIVGEIGKEEVYTWLIQLEVNTKYLVRCNRSTVVAVFNNAVKGVRNDHTVFVLVCKYFCCRKYVFEFLCIPNNWNFVVRQ